MKITILTIIFSLFLTSCSTWTPDTLNARLERIPASELDDLTYYLSMDKFKYYINEYTVSQEGKAPEAIIKYLKTISIENIMEMQLDKLALVDAHKYDSLIWELLKEKGLTNGVSQVSLKWEYNFFKNKLNEAYSLSKTKLELPLDLEEELVNPNDGISVKPKILKAEEMTLDSGHYISNRTTRAIFWEANKSGRTIEFHLGDSREFLKTLKEDKGEVLFEVKPLAKNYNKIYVVQYPGEATYRLAITNIGGFDRLEHLTNQVSLSNFNNAPIKSKIVVNGDVAKFHAAKAEEHATQLRLLPKADRVLIGQKESIDGKFEIFWKINALNNFLKHDQATFQKKISSMKPKDIEKLRTMMFGEANFETIFKDKGIIETAYESLETDIAKNPKLLPEKFKVYNYDNFTIEMCDYVFKNPEGKTIRWRVVSNVWGDEVIPIATALKATGHKNVTYMGTAGAFASKGYKVGDLISPQYVYDKDVKLKMHHKPMSIEGAINAGSVEHVGSPFEESEKWLEFSEKRSEFVEVETSYLRRIFHETTDQLELFLLISDVLGSESETLAHATSSKRKNSQNKLLASVFTRDTKGIPTSVVVAASNDVEAIKRLVFKTLEKKAISYQYYAYSKLKNTKPLTSKEVVAFSEKHPAFSDKFLLDKLVDAGEIIQEIQERTLGKFNFNVAFNKSLVDGTWNPKLEKLSVLIVAKTAQEEKTLKEVLAKILQKNSTLAQAIDWTVSTKVENPNLIWMKSPTKIDIDFFVKIYNFAGFQNAGLYKNVTYNGNLTLNVLPTNLSHNPLSAFYQGKESLNKAGSENSCMTMMRILVEGI
ncbi:MAG: hypothetical protein HOP07_11480 [Bacteriovoracaceae bacterium]|nr:hypothetical protein [Bacteriovoracaceae bacterium]